MITTVTGGLVSVEDGTKAAEEYAPARKVRVEISFLVPEGGSAAPVLDAVSILVTEKVDQLLGKRAAPLSATSTPTLPGVPAKSRAKAKSDDKPEIVAVADAAAVVDDAATVTEPTATPDASAVVDDASVVDEDVFSSGPATAVISDADLNAAVQKKNASLGKPPAIRELIGTFNPDATKVFQLREIPQAQRSDFLAKLDALA